MSLHRLLQIHDNFQSEVSLLERIFDSMLCGIVEFSEKGDILYVNSAALKFFHSDQADFLAKNLFGFFKDSLSPSDFSRLQNEFQQIFQGQKQRARVVIRLKKSEGEDFGSWIIQLEHSGAGSDSCYLFLQPTIVSKPFSKLERDPLSFERIMYQGHLVIMRTDDSFRITDLIGDTEGLFGLTVEQVLTKPTFWSDIMSQKDFRRLSLKVRRLEKSPSEFHEEIAITPVQDQSAKWLMLQVVPVFDKNDTFIGWEGFGVDVTEKRETELALVSERKRIEALYEVSSALQVNLEPELVALKGLRAILRATNSDAGFCCFYDAKKEEIELIAAEGHSERYIQEVSGVVAGKKSLVRLVVQEKVGLILGNIQEDMRASRQVAIREGMKSTIVMPLQYEDQVLGAMVVSCQEPDRYTQDDYDLLKAAASQLALAASQAEYYQAERRQADSLAVLYRLSHELSRLFTPTEVADTAFTLIQEEFACRRLWLGIINEQGTHIVGQAATGPGMRESIRKLQVELSLTHDHLDKALKTKQPIIVPENAEMHCSGLNRLVSRLHLGAFVILPLVSLGQVVGVCIIEPSVSSTSFIKRKLPLLTAMATEIATVLLARRFELKLADADKMRMATVLASGVAHNFNNLLQAVMGQASLIEMQLEKDSPLSQAARTIVDAAGKGANLVKHLLAFSSQPTYHRKEVSLNKLLLESREFFTSLLGAGIQLETELPNEEMLVEGDYGQLGQVLNYILVNAREAIGDRVQGQVKVVLKKVRLRSGEVSAEISPGSYIRIDVEDNGIGMDEDQQIRCFEPFFSTKEVDASTGLSLSGSGLGLSSAYSIVRQHGGSIGITSTPGEGCLFSIYLPEKVIRSNQDYPEGVYSELQESPVLIIDREGATAYSVRSTLESFGLTCRIESDIGRAQSMLSHRDSPILLAIVDLERVGDNAFDLIEQVRASDNDVTFVFCTVNRRKWTTKIRKQTDALLIEKPLSVWAIQSVVRELFPGMGTRSLRDSIDVEYSASTKTSDSRERRDKTREDKDGTRLS